VTFQFSSSLIVSVFKTGVKAQAALAKTNLK